jgi:hypothetical protein
LCLVVVAAAVCEFVVAGFRVVAVSVAVAVDILAWLLVGSVGAAACIFVVWCGVERHWFVLRCLVFGFVLTSRTGSLKFTHTR